MLKIIITSDNLSLPLFHDMMVVDLVHLMNHNVVHIYHNYKDFNSFSVLSPENEISDIFISFYATKVFPNKKLGILIDNVNIYRQSILTKFEFFSC